MPEILLEWYTYRPSSVTQNQLGILKTVIPMMGAQIATEAIVGEKVPTRATRSVAENTGLALENVESSRTVTETVRTLQNQRNRSTNQTQRRVVTRSICDTVRIESRSSDSGS